MAMRFAAIATLVVTMVPFHSSTSTAAFQPVLVFHQPRRGGGAPLQRIPPPTTIITACNQLSSAGGTMKLTHQPKETTSDKTTTAPRRKNEEPSVPTNKKSDQLNRFGMKGVVANMVYHTKQCHFFWGSKSPFSQFHPCSYTLDGYEYTSAEQGMMHGKALLFGDDAIARKILLAHQPREMKQLGRKVRGFSDDVWKEHRWNIVYRNSVAKFQQNGDLLQALLETEGKLLVEASPYDKIWGIGMDAKKARQVPSTQWKGSNLLGQILTQVREDISGAIQSETTSATNGATSKRKAASASSDSNAIDQNRKTKLNRKTRAKHRVVK